MKKYRNVQLLFVSLLFIFGLLQNHLNSINPKPNIQVSKQDEALNFNDNFLRLFSFGQERLVSSLMWAHTLLESDIEHYKKKDLNSWMFLRFKTISALDPNFYENYYFGGKYLSIVKNDLLGAKEIYERGLKVYPNDFNLRFNNGFNYYFEMKEKQKGLKNFQVIENHPLIPRKAPYLPTMLARMRSERGELKIAFDMLYNIYQNNNRDDHFKRRQEEKLFDLKAQIDLKCLNEEEKDSCSTVDFRGRPYIRLKNGKYRAYSY